MTMLWVDILCFVVSIVFILCFMIRSRHRYSLSISLSVPKDWTRSPCSECVVSVLQIDAFPSLLAVDFHGLPTNLLILVSKES